MTDARESTTATRRLQHLRDSTTPSNAEESYDNDRRVRVYMRRCERYEIVSIVFVVVCFAGRRALVAVAGALTGARYRDEVLPPYVAPHLDASSGPF